MKTLLPLLLLSQIALGQRALPFIRATSIQAVILEGKNAEPTDWRLDPGAKPDVHVISKSPKPARVWFCTDIDTLKTTLKPGQKFDFIVLLNGKDSCFTRLESPATVTRYQRQRPATHDTIPFELTEFNNLKIKACLNHTDTLYLKFDSGATGLLLTREAIAQKTGLLTPQPGVERPDFSQMKRYNTLSFGQLSWDSLEVYPVALSGQGTDGRFGWDLFDGRVVEIDYDRNLFIVHSTRPKIAKGYTKLPMEYANSLFCIQGALEIQGKKYPNRFLFDNGYQRTIMLDTSLLTHQHVPEHLKVIKKTIMQNGQGKEFPVVTVNTDGLILGQAALADIPAQKLTTFNPAGFAVHILGNEVLKRFNTILDFQRNCVYLKPNTLRNLPYVEAK